MADCRVKNNRNAREYRPQCAPFDKANYRPPDPATLRWYRRCWPRAPMSTPRSPTAQPRWRWRGAPRSERHWSRQAPNHDCVVPPLVLAITDEAIE
jgi:hypothetical protein